MSEQSNETKALREYVVLMRASSDVDGVVDVFWQEMGVYQGHSAGAAIKIGASQSDAIPGATYAAVPRRSWTQARTSTETVVTTKVEVIT